jgi:hypothetical protein
MTAERLNRNSSLAKKAGHPITRTDKNGDELACKSPLPPNYLKKRG